MPKGAAEGNTNAVKHGLYPVMTRGRSALPEALRARELEAVENLGTHDGVMRELERQALHQLLIVETGFAHLRSILAEGKDLWTSGKDGRPEPVLRMLGSWANGAVRTLAKLAELRGDRDVVDLIDAALEESDGEDHEAD